MSSQQHPLLKQIALIRRRNNMTRKKFFVYHWKVHGAISDVPEPAEKPQYACSCSQCLIFHTRFTNSPSTYVQTHFFDAAIGGKPGFPAGTSNHSWFGRDDMTELYFRDWHHVNSTFTSSYVQDVIGPDGANFADSETTIPLIVTEKCLVFKPALEDLVKPKEGERVIAMLCPAVISQKSNEQVEQTIFPALVQALETYASADVWGMEADMSIPAAQFDVREYFGGKSMPEYPVTYKIILKDISSATVVRDAQKAFLESMRSHIDENNTFIAFGIEGVVLDISRDAKVSIPFSNTDS